MGPLPKFQKGTSVNLVADVWDFSAFARMVFDGNRVPPTESSEGISNIFW
jgi:hypothetical protein